MKSKETNSIAEFVRRLEEASQKPRAADVLREFCRLFDATAIGLHAKGAATSECTFAAQGSVPPNVEWHTDPALLRRVQTSLTTVAAADQVGSWLLCAASIDAADEGQIAWLYRRSPKSSWTDAERLHWLAASQVLARCAAGTDESRLTARRLDQATIITSRLTHDFGNYLTGILGFAELSLAQTPRDASAHRFMQEVLHSAQQGAAWLRRLQLFCRRGGAPIWPTRLATVLAAEEARGRSADTLSLRWDIQIPDDLPLLEIDAAALQALLQELVNNAKEATRNRGTISFTAQSVDLSVDDCKSMLGALQPGPHVELLVADDGPGMNEADRARMLRELFFSTKPRGRGVGLLVVYGILQRFRGGLRLEKTEVGHGVRWRICLPTTVLEEPIQLEGNKPPNVLLAHAHPVVFDSLRVLVEAQGCRTAVADSPQAALAACGAKKASFALVVIDVQMPQMSGYDLARRILDQDAKANFVFVHAEALSHSSSDEGALADFPLLRWPLQPAVVLRTIRTALTDSAG